MGSQHSSAAITGQIIWEEFEFQVGDFTKAVEDKSEKNHFLKGRTTLGYRLTDSS